MTFPRRPASAAAVLACLAGPGLAQEPVTLQLWSWQSDSTEMYDAVFDVYEAAHPGVTIEYRGIPSVEYPTVIRTALSAEGGPDIVMLHPYNSVAPYAVAGQLVPLDEAMIPELGTNFTEESLAASSWEGTTYGVPFGSQTIQVFYNKGLFDELGLAEPTTRSEVPPMLESIREAGITPYAVTGKDSWQLVNVFDALVGTVYGGQAFVERALAGEATWTDPAMVQALADFDALQEDFPRFVSAVTYDDSHALFAAGQAAMFPGGSWELAVIRQNAPDMEVGVFSMPADDAGGPAPTWGYEDGSFGLSARSAHRDEAIEFLRWMATPEFGQLYSDTFKYASSVVGVQPSDPVLEEMIATYQANPVRMIWVTDYFGVSSPAPYAALMTEAQNLLSDATDPEAAAASIQASVEEWTAAAAPAAE